MTDDIEIPPKLMKIVESYFEKIERKYQEENPCPQCGSHNTHFEPTCISGPFSSWSEWCDDCGWSKKTSCFPEDLKK